MPRKFFRRVLPTPQKLKEQKVLRYFGEHIFTHSPHLWHLNRRSATGAITIGMFIAWIPVPVQMFLAAACAIIFRVNLPLSLATVWVTNPVTMVPMYFFAYKVGGWILHRPPLTDFRLEWDWFASNPDIAGVFLFGCFVVGVVSSALSNIAVRIIWRIWVGRSWSLRKKARQADAPKINSDKT